MNRDDTFRKQTDNSPRSHAKFSVLPLCRFRLKSADYWARLTTSRGSFICLASLENGYKVQQKDFTIRNNGHKTTARVRRPAPQSLTMNKLGYLSILPFHSLPFRNKGPTDNSPRSHTEYTLKRQFVPRLARTTGLAPLHLSRACQNRSPMSLFK